MKVGVAQVDITPAPGCDLSGYAARIQPSTGVMDPIYAKALYLENNGKKLLWLHADLIALERQFVVDFRRWAAEALGLDTVLLSATHTHAAPCTITLTSCGRRDPDYIGRLHAWMQRAARQAVSHTEQCTLHVAEAELHLAIDRRNKPSGQTDPHALALGFRRVKDGQFAAVLVNYPMHPVALGGVNRLISPDWCGHTAVAITRDVPGNPICLVTNGACGNINPPAEAVPRQQVVDYGETIARALVDRLVDAKPVAHPNLRFASEIVSLPLEVQTPEQIDATVREELGKLDPRHMWYQQLQVALDHWERHLKQDLAAGRARHIDIELFALGLGPVCLVAVNCEMFAHFTLGLREKLGEHVYTVGYANGAFGYVAHAAAYDEGGYEVASAHYFYNSFRPRRGGLEMLRDRAVHLLASLSTAVTMRA